MSVSDSDDGDFQKDSNLVVDFLAGEEVPASNAQTEFSVDDNSSLPSQQQHHASSSATSSMLVQHVVMVTNGDHVMLLDDGSYIDDQHAMVFDESLPPSGRPPESFINSFDTTAVTDCLGQPGTGVEGYEERQCQLDGTDHRGELCLMTSEPYDNDNRSVVHGNDEVTINDDVVIDCYDATQSTAAAVAMAADDDEGPVVQLCCDSEQRTMKDEIMEKNDVSTAEAESEMEMSGVNFLMDGTNEVLAHRSEKDSSTEEDEALTLSNSLLMHANTIYQMLPNGDGTLSLVSIDPQQLGQLLRSRQQGNNMDHASVICISGANVDYAADSNATSASSSGLQLMQMRAVDVNAVTATPPLPASQPEKKLPPGCPAWASALNDCEQIGDSYRGWVETENDMNVVLATYKHLTHSYWGTRQSPSSARQSTRLMWKSQYVPFDGIPFVNEGSRAIVYECHYGPRRKNNAKKSPVFVANGDAQPLRVFKPTCPARIYVKKVKKFVEYGVNPLADKKQLKADMESAFQLLKDNYLCKPGQERYYIQLPTSDAHEFHIDAAPTPVEEATSDSGAADMRRLHPQIAQKIRELVSSGEIELYAIRHHLRKYVEKELFEGGSLPEKHDLTFYPTIHDLQNHIHQALKDINAGVLPIMPKANVKMELEDLNGGVSEVNTTDEAPIVAEDSKPNGTTEEVIQELLAGDTAAAGCGASGGGDDLGSRVDMVTLLLTSAPGEDGDHTVSRVELRLSNGTTHVTSVVPPEVAHLISTVSSELFTGTHSVLSTSSASFALQKSAEEEEPATPSTLLDNGHRAATIDLDGIETSLDIVAGPTSSSPPHPHPSLSPLPPQQQQLMTVVHHPYAAAAPESSSSPPCSESPSIGCIVESSSASSPNSEVDCGSNELQPNRTEDCSAAAVARCEMLRLDSAGVCDVITDVDDVTVVHDTDDIVGGIKRTGKRKRCALSVVACGDGESRPQRVKWTKL